MSLPLIAQITEGLKQVRQKLADSPQISQDDAVAIQTIARSLIASIEGDGPKATPADPN
jgi:hypothetical protein